ncbi:MAG: DNA replication and repair protein RecF [Flavobacteriales bacterium]|nr:DNA replication and repair protein RecF [Flavobacteriales bacterium]NNK81309.1 DNA replication and repair protein RecF [Flavobacteriales bacterium]
MDLLLQKLHLFNFKNHKDLSLEFCQEINCIVGSNGSGKTNILESIYYLSFCKGYFNPQDSQNIHHGDDHFSIRGEFVKDVPVKLTCAVQLGQRKRFKKDDKEYERLADHVGGFPVVIISPYDVDLIREGSEARRKFMDMVISLDDKEYLLTLIDYNRALAQRNNLLKFFWENRTMDKEQLSIWNIQLSDLGRKIYNRRKAFFEDFRTIFKEYQSAISKGKDRADIRYRSQLRDEDMLSALDRGLDRDMARHHTLFGIHKDDMEMVVDGHPVKKFGSQGQQKTFLIALKLAQFQFIKNRSGLKPLLLLDDVFDKIDDERVEYMIELVSKDIFGQIFITDTSRDRLDKVLASTDKDYRIIEMTESTQEVEA